MKFRHKLILILVINFIIFVEIFAYFIVKYYNNIAIEREIASSKNEEQLLKNIIISEFDQLIIRGGEINQNVIINTVNYYSYIFEGTNTDVSIFQNENEILSEIYIDGNYLTIIEPISSDNKYKDMYIEYKKDITDITLMQDKFNKAVMTLNIIFTLFFIVECTISINYMTKPLNDLLKGVENVTDGYYKTVIEIKNKDEIGQLADSFNEMTVNLDEKIIKLNKMVLEKQSLIDNLSHELRTPLTSIKGYSELLLIANINEDEKYNSLKYIISETDRLKELSDRLLELSTINNIDIDKDVFYIDSFIQKIADIEKLKCLENNINLNFNIKTKTIYGNETLMTSLLINLIDNAIKASNKNSSIEICIFDEQNNTIIEVTDYGKGMDKETIDKIFLPFFTVDTVKNREFSGVGIGLTLCEKIVKSHNGTISVHSEIHNFTNFQCKFPKK